MHRDSRVREGDDAGRVSPFATPIGMIAALTKDKYAAVALNNVNNGGGVNELIKKFFLILRSLERSIALMTSVDC